MIYNILHEMKIISINFFCLQFTLILSHFIILKIKNIYFFLFSVIIMLKKHYNYYTNI